MAKILLAEDDVNLREIFEMRLKAEGFDVVTAGDGEEALVAATRELPDLAVIDVMMPKISGFEMLETLRSNPQTAGIKAVMMTALGQAEDRERGEHLGVLKYLVKSQVTLEDFVRSIHEILDSSQNNNQQRSSMDPTQQPTQDNQAMPPASPAPAADPMATDTSTTPAPVPADSAEGTEQEKSEVQEQVDSFASSPAPEPAASPQTAQPADMGSSAMPAPEPTPEVPAPETATPSPEAAPTAPEEATGTMPGSTVEPSMPQDGPAPQPQQ